MNNMLPTPYQNFIALSRYACWTGDKREAWSETVDRYVDNIVKPVAGDDSYISDIREAIMSLEVMPSMRAMMTAGKAAERDNTCMYNCSYVAVDKPTRFDEAMFILLCGTGVGFSVERQFISKLPEVTEAWSTSGKRVLRQTIVTIPVLQVTIHLVQAAMHLQRQILVSVVVPSLLMSSYHHWWM